MWRRHRLLWLLLLLPLLMITVLLVVGWLGLRLLACLALPLPMLPWRRREDLPHPRPRGLSNSVLSAISPVLNGL